MIRHTCLIVKNLNQAIKFYTKNFGLRVVVKDILTGDYPITLFGISQIKINYAKISDKKGNTIELLESNRALRPHIAFTVKDVNKVYKKLKKTVIFISPPIKAPDYPVKICHLYDMDLNEIEIVEDI